MTCWSNIWGNILYLGIIEFMMVELIACNLGHWDKPLRQDFRQAIYPEALEMGESMEEPGSGSKCSRF